MYQFDCSVLRFSIENCSNTTTKPTSCCIFLFDISKITKLMKQFWKKPRQLFPWRFGALTGGFDEKLGDSLENRESWRLCMCFIRLLERFSNACRKTKAKVINRTQQEQTTRWTSSSFKQLPEAFSKRWKNHAYKAWLVPLVEKLTCNFWANQLLSKVIWILLCC